MYVLNHYKFTQYKHFSYYFYSVYFGRMIPTYSNERTHPFSPILPIIIHISL